MGVILKWVLKMCEGVEWVQLTQDPVADSCERDNTLSNFTKGGKFLDQN